MNEKDSLLISLYAKEKELLNQLEAIQTTIKAFGGNTKKVESVKPKAEKPVKIKVGPIVKPEKIEAPRKEESTRNKREDIDNFIIEVLKELNVPCKPKLIAIRLDEMGIKYEQSTIDTYMRSLEKDDRIIHAGPGLFAHKDYIAPKPMERKVKTIYDVLDYLELRKQSTRQELVSFFVTGGRFNEARLDIRLDKLIQNKNIERIERGVYKFITKDMKHAY